MKISAETFRKYACLVQETRQAQNLYFSVRSTHNLKTAKQLEKRLDQNTEAILQELKKIENNQLPLF